MTALAPERGYDHGRHMRELRQDRIAEYLFIGGEGMLARQAAARLGVSERTVWRYRAILRQRTQELAQ